MLVPLGALTSPVGDSVPPGAGVSFGSESEHATIETDSAAAAITVTTGPRRRRRAVAGLDGTEVTGERMAPRYPGTGSPTTIG